MFQPAKLLSAQSATTRGGARSTATHPLRLLALSVAVAAAMGTSMVMAQSDDYAEVNRLMRAGQMSDALTKVDAYLASKPRDPQMRFLKGVIQSEGGKPTDAIATFSKLTEDFPELPEPYNNLAVLYAGQSQFDKARAALEMAIRTNPSYATAHENLGDVYAKLASQAYSKALQLDATNTAVAPKLSLIRNLFVADAKGVRPSAAAPASPSASGRLRTRCSGRDQSTSVRTRSDHRATRRQRHRRCGSSRDRLGQCMVLAQHGVIPWRLRTQFHTQRRPIAQELGSRAQGPHRAALTHRSGHRRLDSLYRWRPCDGQVPSGLRL